MTSNGLRRGLDRLGWLELSGLGVWSGVAIGLEVAQLVNPGHEDSAPTLTAWRIAAVAGAITCALVMVLGARQWRKHGGRQVQRLGRQVWMTGRLPARLPARIAALHDLQRRERDLQRARIPAWGLAALWTVLVAWHLASQPSPLVAVTWLVLWSFFLTTGVIDIVDRATRHRLRELIAEIRHDTAPAPLIGAGLA